MGNCGAKPQRKISQDKSLFLDIDQYEKETFDKSTRQFKIHFQKIKVKNVPSNKTYVHVNFDNSHAFETPLIQDKSLNPTWLLNHEFEYQVDDENLKKQAFVQFFIRDSHKQDLGSLKISLQLVATGPFHHDIQIHWKNVSSEFKNRENYPGRLQFDLKMSQQIKFEILPKTIKCNLLEGMKEKAYNFTFKVIVPSTEYVGEYCSEHSENYLNPAQNAHLQNLYSSPSPSHVSTRMIAERMNYLKDLQNQNIQSPSSAKTIDVAVQRMNLIRKKSSFSNQILEKKIDSPADQMNEVRLNVEKSQFSHQQLQYQNNQSQQQLTPQLEEEKQEEDQDLQQQKSIIRYSKNIKTENITGFMAEEEFDPELMLEKQKKIQPKGRTSAFGDIVCDYNIAQKQIQEKHYMIWDYIGLESELIPDIVFGINSKDIANSTIALQIWGVQPFQQEMEGENNLEQYPLLQYTMIGECYMSLNKLISSQGDKMISQKGECFEERRHTFNEILRKDGIKLGEIEGEFIIQNTQFVKQMILGIMTEQGIRKNSTSIYQPVISEQQQTEVIDNLTELTDRLIDDVFKLSLKKQSLERIRLRNNIGQNLKDISQILIQKHKQSVHSFYYKSEKDLIQAQKLLIQLGNYLIDYDDEVEQSLKPMYYDCLKLIMNRGEFNLESIGINENKPSKSVISKAEFQEDQKHLKQKLEIGLDYQLLMYTTLHKTLKKLKNKALIENERQFVENFLALAYFRIPQFRTKLLDSLKKPDDDEKIPEWRGTEHQLEEDYNFSKSNKDNHHLSYFHSLFDWEGCFYKFMLNTEVGKSNFKYLQETVLEDNVWQKKLGKRSIAFFFFLNEWALYIKNTVVVKEQVPWYDLPGYKQIVKAFLLEMKNRDIDKYPDSLKTASVTMLNNEKLINILVQFVFQKTSVYDSYMVIRGLEIINSWFQTLKQNRKRIPTQFDFTYFLKGLWIILSDEHSYTMTQAISLIYNNFCLFPHEFRKELCNLLLGPIFYKLFMHWSKDLRNIFHYLIIFRVFHLHRASLTKVETLKNLQYMIINQCNHVPQIETSKKSFKYQEKINHIILKINRDFAITQETIQKLHQKLMDQKQQEIIKQQELNQNQSRLSILKEKLRQRRNKQQQYNQQQQFPQFSLQQASKQFSNTLSVNRSTNRKTSKQIIDAQDIHDLSCLQDQNSQKNNQDKGILIQTIEKCKFNLQKKKFSADDISFPDCDSELNSEQVEIAKIEEQKSDESPTKKPQFSRQDPQYKCYHRSHSQTQQAFKEIEGEGLSPISGRFSLKKSMSEDQSVININQNNSNNSRIMNDLDSNNISINNYSSSKQNNFFDNTDPKQQQQFQSITPNKYKKQFTSPQIVAQQKVSEFNFSQQRPLIKKSKLDFNTKDKLFISLDSIEKQYLQYLDKAMEEYQAIQHKYIKWYDQKITQLKNQTEKQQRKYMLEFIVPEININLSLDKGESNIKSEYDW